MADVAEVLGQHGVRYAVIGAMAAAVHGVVRASLDADAVVAIPVPDAQSLQRVLAAAGYTTDMRLGDIDDPIPALLRIGDGYGNRVDLLIGLRGMDPAVLERTQKVALAGAALDFVGREDFIAMKAFAGGPLDLADARAVIDAHRASLDTTLLRNLAWRFGGETEKVVEELMRPEG
jgi:predicted nucleotidyltransferase